MEPYKVDSFAAQSERADTRCEWTQKEAVGAQ
jgi:hypothetical protein